MATRTRWTQYGVSLPRRVWLAVAGAREGEGAPQRGAMGGVGQRRHEVGPDPVDRLGSVEIPGHASASSVGRSVTVTRVPQRRRTERHRTHGL